MESQSVKCKAHSWKIAHRFLGSVKPGRRGFTFDKEEVYYLCSECGKEAHI